MEPLDRRVLAEFLGSALLSAVVVGSGIAAQRLSPHDLGVQLLANAAATAVGLTALIVMFAPVSGAHFNPVVTLAERFLGKLATRDVSAYIASQVAGCCAGTLLANAMFARPTLELATHVRSSGPLWLSEAVATAGLVVLIFSCSRSGRSAITAPVVGAYIGGAYFWASSTSFANPAITLGRTLSDSFAGIAPSSAPAFIGSQLVGLVIALLIVRALYPSDASPS